MKLEKQTRDFIARLQPSAPVKITALAKVLGLEVWESKSLQDGVAGKLRRDTKNGGSGGFSIIIRAQDPMVRKRFTVAHEIAHYLLHRHLLIGTELVDDSLYRSGLSTKVEAEANGLAADLLMPWHLLVPLMDLATNELAKLFEVSTQAMEIRLQSGGSEAGIANRRNIELAEKHG